MIELIEHLKKPPVLLSGLWDIINENRNAKRLIDLAFQRDSMAVAVLG